MKRVRPRPSSNAIPQRLIGSASYFAVNASLITVLRGFGVASGLVLDAVVAGFFGLGHQTDAYFAALAVPYLIASTVETQAAKVLVPFFAQGFERNGREATWSQLRNLIATGGVLFSVLAGTLTVGAWLLLPAQVPGLDPEAMRRAIQLQMILAWLVLIQSVSTFITGALYADHHYITTNISRLTTNSVAIIFVVLWHDRLGIYALGLGVTVGAGAQLACLVSAACWRGFTFGGVQFRDPGVMRVLRLCVYPVLGQTMSESRVFLENFLGSLLGAGSLSAVRYANRVVSALAGILVGGVATTALPMLSHYAADERFEEMKNGLLTAIRWAALLAVPLGLWLIFAGEPLIAVAFQRGRFTSSESAQVGMLLALLAPYVLASRVVDLAELAFYASLDMRTPLWAIVVFLSAYVILCFPLLPRFGVLAFAIATSGASILAAWFMVWLVQRRFGPFRWVSSRDFVRRLAIVGAVTTIGLWTAAASISAAVNMGLGANVARLLSITGAGLIAFLSSGCLLRLFNWRYIVQIVREAWRAKGAAPVPRNASE